MIVKNIEDIHIFSRKQQKHKNSAIFFCTKQHSLRFLRTNKLLSVQVKTSVYYIDTPPSRAALGYLDYHSPTVVTGHVHDHFCLKRRKGWCIFSNSVKKTVGCLSLGWRSAAFFHSEAQGSHIFWDQKAAISGIQAPPESLSPLFLPSWGEMGLAMLFLPEPVLPHFLLASMEVGRALLCARDSGEQGKGEAPGTEPDNTENADIN